MLGISALTMHMRNRKECFCLRSQWQKRSRNARRLWSCLFAPVWVKPEGQCFPTAQPCFSPLTPDFPSLDWRNCFQVLAGKLTESPCSPCVNPVQAKSECKIKIVSFLQLFYNTISLRIWNTRKDYQTFIWLAYTLIDEFDNTCSLMIFTQFVQLGILKECWENSRCAKCYGNSSYVSGVSLWTK